MSWLSTKVHREQCLFTLAVARYWDKFLRYLSWCYTVGSYTFSIVSFCLHFVFGPFPLFCLISIVRIPLTEDTKPIEIGTNSQISPFIYSDFMFFQPLAAHGASFDRALPVANVRNLQQPKQNKTKTLANTFAETSRRASPTLLFQLCKVFSFRPGKVLCVVQPNTERNIRKQIESDSSRSFFLLTLLFSLRGCRWCCFHFQHHPKTLCFVLRR